MFDPGRYFNGQKIKISGLRGNGFTVVELLIVIVVVAILAAITVAAFNGIQSRAIESSLQADLRNGSRQVDVIKSETGELPIGAPELNPTPGNSFQYSRLSVTSYCLSATSVRAGGKAFYVQDGGAITNGVCAGHIAPVVGGGGVVIADGAFIQNITNDNCPTERTRAVDKRDGRTYWVKKVSDGKCWMLTNLAYAGGGNDMYGDTKNLLLAGALSFTEPRYYIPAGANPTSEPISPSVSTTGSGQYGYLYNWCAAMGGQPTAACANALTPAPDVSTTICPAGWRLPTMGPGGDFYNLNVAVNPGASNDENLRIHWLAQRAGQYTGSVSGAGAIGNYWSSHQALAGNASFMYSAHYQLNEVSNHASKSYARSVRCLT